MLDALIMRKRGRFLTALADRVNPLLDPRSGVSLRNYYWTIGESEYATDVMFSSAADLAALYPSLIAHAMSQFACQDVLRFLGRRVNAAVQRPGHDQLSGSNRRSSDQAPGRQQFDQDVRQTRVCTQDRDDDQQSPNVPCISGEDPERPSQLGVGPHAQGIGRHRPACGSEPGGESART